MQPPVRGDRAGFDEAGLPVVQGHEASETVFFLWGRSQCRLGRLERFRRLRFLRRSARTRLLFHELTPVGDSSGQAIDQAIHTLSESDPLVKLLQEVKLGRMKPSDPGLRAITESWIDTYTKVLDTSGLDRTALARLDPSPRLAVLIEAGVLPAEHPGVASLRVAFRKALSGAHQV